MIAIAAAALAAATPQGWTCRNVVEVACNETDCRTAPPGDFTPMDISAGPNGLSVCAYSGCWEARAKPLARRGRLLWAASAAFSTAPEPKAQEEVTLLIIEKDGAGFVRVGGFSTPLLCRRG